MISVVIPVFNAEKTIAQTLDSVLSQTYREFEVVVVDDCSKDQSKAIIDSYAQKYENIHLFVNQQNQGVGFCRNKGVEMATGEYIAFLDADDCWRATKLEKQMECVNAHPEGVLFYTGSTFMKEDGQEIASILSAKNEIGYKELLHQNIISCSSVLVEKSTIQNYPFLNGRDCHEDYVTWLQILKDGHKAYGVDEPLLVYRLAAKSKSSNKLHSAVMNWNTYRYVGLNVFERGYYMVHYAVNGLLKYSKIKLKK